MLSSNIRPGLLIALLGVAFLIVTISPFFEEYGQFFQSKSTQSFPERGRAPSSRVVVTHASTQTESEVVPLDGGAVLPSAALQWPEKEICVIWYVQPDMDQFNHVMDHILGGIDGHYISLIHDEGGHQSRFCQEHTLVVTYCSQEHLDSMVYSKAKEQGVERLGLMCLADEDSVLTAQVVSGAHYVLHEFGTIEGAANVMATPLGPTNGFGADLNPRLRWPPAPERPRHCAFKGRPCSDERKALFNGPAALKDRCDIVNTEGYKMGAHPHGFRAQLLATSVCLCPKGASYEQFRLWESLESGCLPVTTNASPMPAILGHTHPLPTMTPQQWIGGEGGAFGDLIGTIERYTGTQEAAMEKRREVEAWFTWYKRQTQQRAAALMLGSGHVDKNGTTDGRKDGTTERMDGIVRQGGEGTGDWLEAREAMLAAMPMGPAASTTCLVYATRQELPEHSFVMDGVLRGLRQDTALVPYWSAEFMAAPRAHQCDAVALVFEHTLDAGLIAYALQQKLRRLVLLALRLDEHENGVTALREQGLWPQITGVLADAGSLAILRPSLEGIKAEDSAGNLRTATSRRASTSKRETSMPLVLLPWGPRSGFGNGVSMPQAMRPAAKRTHRCIRLKESDDATWGPKPSGLTLSDAEWEQLCPIVDVRQLKRSSDGQLVASEPSHLRVLLLDTVYAILPSASEHRDTNLVWEALACGAIPVVPEEGHAVTKGLAGAEGLLPSVLPVLGSSSALLAPTQVGSGEASTGALQRDVFTWGLAVKRWVEAQTADLLSLER